MYFYECHGTRKKKLVCFEKRGYYGSTTSNAESSRGASDDAKQRAAMDFFHSTAISGENAKQKAQAAAHSKQQEPIVRTDGFEFPRRAREATKYQQMYTCIHTQKIGHSSSSSSGINQCSAATGRPSASNVYIARARKAHLKTDPRVFILDAD